MRLRGIAETGARALEEYRSRKTDPSFESSVDGPDGLLHDDFHIKAISKILRARVEAIRFSGEDPKTGFSWEADDINVGLMVPLRFKSRYTPENISASCQTLARFVTFNGLHQSALTVGNITHRPLAIMATRYGFHTAPVPVNPEIDDSMLTIEGMADAPFPPMELATAQNVRHVLKTYDRLGLGRGKPAERRQALYTYMPMDEFLDLYAEGESLKWRENPPRVHEVLSFNSYGYPDPREHIGMV